MNKIYERFRNAGAGIIAGARRFPAGICSAIAIMILTLILIHSTALADSLIKRLIRICLTLGLGIPLSVVLQLCLERFDVKKPMVTFSLWVALGALLTLYLFFLLPNMNQPEPGLRFAGLLLSAIALVPAIPYLFRRKGDEQYALNLLLRFLITALFTGILIGGLDLVLLMIDSLLKIKLWDHAYIDIAVVSTGLFAPSFLLAGIPHGSPDFGEERFHPLVRILLGFIAYPLLTAYTVIIYIYFIQIFLHWSWPSNMLVNMVLWYTAIGVLAVYFMRTQNTGNKWFHLFDTWYPRLTVLPIALLFVGLFIRICAYGFTEPRFFVLMLALWVTAATVIAIFYKPDRRINVIVPTLIAVLALMAVLGPWNAFSVSSASQNARLENLLRKNSMLSSSGKIKPQTNVPDTDKQKIYSILDYFERNQGLGKVRALPGGADISSLQNVLGFDRTGLPAAQNTDEYISAGTPLSSVDIAGYDYLYIYNGNVAPQVLPNGVEMAVNDQLFFMIKQNSKEIYTKDMKEYVKKLGSSFVQGKQYTSNELTFIDENDIAKIKYIINQADINSIDGVQTFSISSFYAMVKLR